MSQYVALRSLHRDVKIRVQDAISPNLVQLQTNVDTMVDLDLSYNRQHLYHHSAIGQYIVTATNSNITAISGGNVVISGALTNLYTNVVQGNPANIPAPS